MWTLERLLIVRRLELSDFFEDMLMDEILVNIPTISEIDIFSATSFIECWCDFRQNYFSGVDDNLNQAPLVMIIKKTLLAIVGIITII